VTWAFRLTYEGELLAHRDDARLPERCLHVHSIRKKFHEQLKNLWEQHPVLDKKRYARLGMVGAQPFQDFDREGFIRRPLVTDSNGLICALDVLMLREGAPGRGLQDVDNRLKTIFDALRMPKGPQELGVGTQQGKVSPASNENPFLVLLEDDRLITHVSVTTDMLLEMFPKVTPGNGVRLFITVTVRPYDVHMENLALT
jgi:hypothetical protein